MAEIFNALANTGMSFGLGLLNNYFGLKREQLARSENYHYNEMAAQNADTRTRSLYNDLYSPQALLSQYKKAGLSPSLMFGGTPGQGGQAGALSSGSAGQPSTYMPISLVDAAQASLMAAQINKTEAETKNVEANTENIKQDTEMKEIQTRMDEMMKNKYAIEYTLMTGVIQKDNGQDTSLFEMAENYFSYDSYLKAVKELATGDLRIQVNTEAGQQVLRSIYMARNYMERDLTVLAEQTAGSKFQKSIVDAMANTDFANLNAQNAIKYLEQNIETSELNKTQKEAWNNLISRLGKEGSMWRDIVVVLGMIVNNVASNWHMPSINNYNTTDNSVRTFNVKGQ